MMNINPKFVRGQYCVELHNYYIQNYMLGLEIIVQFNDRHFLVIDDIFVVTFYYVYDLYNLDALNISPIRCFALYVCKN
jgi:hypothetical protein